MKMITFFVLSIATLSLCSCGGKNSGGGSEKSISQLQVGEAYTKRGYYNTQTQALEIDGVTYPPSQAYSSLMNQAIQSAQSQNIAPVLIDGVYKFRAVVSGVATGSAGFSTVGYQQNYNPYGQQTLQLTSVSFYR
jgi:hypothetical protein